MSLFRIGALATIGMMVYMDEAGGDGGDGGSAAAAATPAAAAAPAVEVPAAVKGDAEVLDAAGYAPADNDPGLNYAMKFLASNGFNADNPAVAAAFDGDFSLLKAELAQKGLAGWEQALGLAEQSYERHTKELDAKAGKVGEIVTGLAAEMGVDWEQAVQHVANAAKPEEKTALNSLLSDPATAHIAAHYITSAFINGGDTEIEPAARPVDAAVGAVNGPAGGALSRREYNAELGKLRTSLGDAYMDSPQAQALYRRLQR